ncbi:MAG TPA: hypothetical protein VHQ47_15870 [Phycisphaerae bacterium]|jgi:hypothetical protein|nr:hypothetical protein [Phycisphaerae bacterium]
MKVWLAVVCMVVCLAVGAGVVLLVEWGRGGAGGAAAAAAPYAGKSFDSPKYGTITFRPDGIYLSSDQRPFTAKWFRVDDTHAVVWTEGGWGTLFVFDPGKSASAYSIGHVDDKAAWVAPQVGG